MIRKMLFAVCLVSAFSANAWSWFGLAPYDEADTNRPPRIHRLLEKANDLIELAEDEAINGEGDKALELYREALKELDRVEQENPKRAETAEFAPLRNKRATCTAAIESIRFAQINDNLRAITVSDSAELRKKYNKKHGIGAEANSAEESNGQDAENAAAAGNADEASPGKDWRNRLKKAYDLVKARDYADADVILAELLEVRPSDLDALLLRAAAQCGTGNVAEARNTLERANRAHPRSYLPYYNLAYVTLDLGEGENAAREYYNLGRTVGGPRDMRLEARFILRKEGAGKK